MRWLAWLRPHAWPASPLNHGVTTKTPPPVGMRGERRGVARRSGLEGEEELEVEVGVELELELELELEPGLPAAAPVDVVEAVHKSVHKTGS